LGIVRPSTSLEAIELKARATLKNASKPMINHPAIAPPSSKCAQADAREGQRLYDGASHPHPLARSMWALQAASTYQLTNLMVPSRI